MPIPQIAAVVKNNNVDGTPVIAVGMFEGNASIQTELQVTSTPAVNLRIIVRI